MTSVLAFIDAAVIAYTRYDAPQRPACTEIMSWVADGRLPAITSVLVIEEVWHLEHRGRPALPEGTARAASELFPVLLSVTPDHLRAALEYPPSSLGTADRLHAAVAIDAGCEVIVTTDRAFDGLDGLRRVDPLDTHAVTALRS
ncbi:MAG: type II toxin-antitoxin system VapC family toxin [Actinomycetota bacterium]|nr:type II toxin-antitoxin system VapC family toxin [Actinomycetota bacterium]